jgi:hypothetical protein
LLGSQSVHGVVVLKELSRALRDFSEGQGAHSSFSRKTLEAELFNILSKNAWEESFSL